jgi:predicted phage tail protein
MIHGSGGPSGGSSSFRQTPDNLRSTDTFEGVLGVCIGPVKGPKNGLKSIKLDGTPLEDAAGNLNFQDFVGIIGDGDPAKYPQTVNLKLGAGASPVPVSLALTNSSSTDPGPWVTKTLNNTGATFIDFRFVVQQLFRQDKDGIYGATATIEIEMKPIGSTNWINPTLNNPSGSYNPTGVIIDTVKVMIPESNYDEDGNWKAPDPNFVITGKTTSAAVYELRIAVPNTDAYANTGWDVRARLRERDSYEGGENGADQEKRTIQWESIAAVYSTSMGDHEDWRGLAWLQLYGKASDQLTGVPEVTGEWDTKIISVPPGNVYDPAARSYAVGGIWDGSWAKAFCNDPAWVVNDAITDALSGLSLIAPGSYLNKWDALELSKWCSEPVPDGNGGFEPRYSLNLAISEAQKAEDFIRYLAGAVGALAWDQGDGEWRIKVDKPDSPIDIFTLENVQGEFVYSHTDVDTRFNAVIGQFKNAEMDYRQDAVTIYDNTSIANIGRKPSTVTLVGCTGRQEAMRRLKLRVRTAVNETKIVNFTTNRRGRNIEPLSTILIADGDLGAMDARTTGRVIAVAEDRRSLTVRDPMRLEVGVTYTLKFALPNSSYSPETLIQPTSENWTKPTIIGMVAVINSASQRGNVNTIYLNSPLPVDVDPNLVVALEATDLPTLPRMYRVTSVIPQDDGELISISAINIDTGKWDAADNVTKDDTVFQDLRGAVPSPLPPTDGPVLSVYTTPAPQGKHVVLDANWIRPSGAFISGFRVEYSINGGAAQTATPRTQDSSFDLVNPVAGVYEFKIYTLDRRGGVSKPLVATAEVTQALLDASDISYADGTPLEDLKPAEGGATSGAPDGTMVGGVPAEDVATAVGDVSDIKTQIITMAQDIALNANTLLAYQFNTQTLRDYVDGKLYVDGVAVNTAIATEKSERLEGDAAIAETINLIGARNGDSSAFILNYNTVKSSETGQTLAATFNSINAATENNAASITDLRTIVITPGGAAVAKAVLQLDSSNKVVGYQATNDGTVGSIIFNFDAFVLLNPATGTSMFTASGGVVKMPSVEIDKLKVNTAVVPKIIASTAYYGGNDATQTLMTTNIVMPTAGYVSVNAVISQGFSAVPRGWTLSLYIDGVQVGGATGTYPGDSTPVIGSKLCNAGTIPIVMQWIANGAVHVSAQNYVIQGYPNTQ